MADEKNNTGKENTGENNSGNSNSGYWNSGNSNSGDSNSGYWNSGDSNSGYWNSGNSNSGYWNSGDSNSGYSNSGNSNSGYWNSGDSNSGFLNTTEPKVRIFNKETELSKENIDFPDFFYFELTEWIEFDKMTDEEKKNNSFAQFTQGYLKTYNYKEVWMKSFEKADKEDVEKLLKLPNFDYALFEEISGISKGYIDVKLGKRYKRK